MAPATAMGRPQAAEVPTAWWMGTCAIDQERHGGVPADPEHGRERTDLRAHEPDLPLSFFVSPFYCAMSPQNIRVRPFACTLPHNALEPDLWAAWGYE